jgi:hypothetical protein
LGERRGNEVSAGGGGRLIRYLSWIKQGLTACKTGNLTRLSGSAAD